MHDMSLSLDMTIHSHIHDSTIESVETTKFQAWAKMSDEEMLQKVNWCV